MWTFPNLISHEDLQIILVPQPPIPVQEAAVEEADLGLAPIYADMVPVQIQRCHNISGVVFPGISRFQISIFQGFFSFPDIHFPGFKRCFPPKKCHFPGFKLKWN